MCDAYLDDLRNRWMRMAYAARYGHQPIASLLGRTPTDFELELFNACLEEWLEAEAPEIPNLATTNA